MPTVMTVACAGDTAVRDTSVLPVSAPLVVVTSKVTESLPAKPSVVTFRTPLATELSSTIWSAAVSSMRPGAGRARRTAR